MAAHDSSGKILLKEGSEEHTSIKWELMSGIRINHDQIQIVSIHKFSPEDINKKHEYSAFTKLSEDTATKNGGNAQEMIKYAFYGGYKDEIERIFSEGFRDGDLSRFEEDAESHGIGIHLVPSKFSFLADLVAGSVRDEEGLSYLLVCPGKCELIKPGAQQYWPSSSEFDSGVDDLNDPNYYIIWSSTIKTRIFPSHIITFRAITTGWHLGCPRTVGANKYIQELMKRNS